MEYTTVTDAEFTWEGDVNHLGGGQQLLVMPI